VRAIQVGLLKEAVSWLLSVVCARNADTSGLSMVTLSGNYSLSVMDGDVIRHYKITNRGGGRLELSGCDGKLFNGLPELVKYYIDGAKVRIAPLLSCLKFLRIMCLSLNSRAQ
jgi:hypothetical protein